MDQNRRSILALGLLGAAAPPTPWAAAAPPAQPSPRGIEGQRKADRGDGTFLNPILAGDHPDPTILKDGANYYMVFSAFESYPALLIWHSRDLVNWTPLAPALGKVLGTIFAVDLSKHDNRYFIYVPVIPADFGPQDIRVPSIFVIYADSITGPWSEPIDLGIRGYIDPAHMVGEDGARYLFLSGVSLVRLRDDGLATDGPITPSYQGWPIPNNWVIEAFSLEGPKPLRRGRYFYLVTAEGGTSGPPTGHMVTVARALSVHGPWENCPHNPIVRTQEASERWWSRGHATLVEGPGGAWFMVYHGYENGFRNLGRQTLLQQVRWSEDGWPVADGGDLSRPLAKPLPRQHFPHGLARSDDFSAPSFGVRWHFYRPGEAEMSRARIENNALWLKGKGESPTNASPLTGCAGDHAYEVTVAIALEGAAQAGLLLFFNRDLYLGMGFDGAKMLTYKSGRVSYWHEHAPASRALHLRIVNDLHIVTFLYSLDGVRWTEHGVRSEVSGYNANTMDDLASLRPALFACGSGAARFTNFTYRAL